MIKAVINNVINFKLWHAENWKTEIQTFTKPENLSAENRKCIKRAPDIIFIKKGVVYGIRLYLDI